MSVLSTFNTTTEVRPLSKSPNPQLLPGRRSIVCPQNCVCACACVCVCVCVFTTVCVCTWMGKMHSTNSEYGSPYLAIRHFKMQKFKIQEDNNKEPFSS